MEGGPTSKREVIGFEGKLISLLSDIVRVSSMFRPKAWERDPEGRFGFGSQHGGMNVAKILRECEG